MAAAKSEKSVSPHRLAERKRRRRELIAVGVAGATLVAFVFAQTELPPLTRHTSLVSNLAVISLFNLSFLLLGLMLFLVGRNLAKVIFERRRGLIGSKFQVRLVAGFIAVALIPSAFLLYVSGVFLHADINSWFNPEYEQILNDSLEIAKTYYLNSANNASHFARVLAEQIAAQGLLAPGKHEQLKEFINRQQEEYNLGTIEVFSADRKLLLIDISPKTPTGIGASPDSPIISQTLKGQTLTRTDRLGSADVIRGSAPIYVSSETDNVLGAVLVDYYLPQSLATRATNISRVSEDYFQLRILRQPIMNSYLLTLVLIGLVVVSLASWFGIFLSRGITGPIKMLARGTQAIAGGDLNFRIPAVGDDEIGQLVDSFNQMTADLRASAAELERRRQYTETLLRNVSAGVVGLDHDGVVTAINPCAERLLDLKAADVDRPQLPGRVPAGSRPRARRRVRLRDAPARGPLDHQARSGGRRDRADDDGESARRRARRAGRNGAVLRGRQPDCQGRADGGVARSRAPNRARDQESADSDPAFGRASAPPARRAPGNRIHAGRGMHQNDHRRSRGSEASRQ